MTIAAKCLVCRNADRRRLIEAGWNAGMGAETMSRVLGDSPSAGVITKHIKEHGEGDGNMRALVVQPDRPMRERVLDIQRMQVDEIERRIALAKQRAIQINGEHEGEADWEERDWSEFTDILGKDMQAAIGSILKTQGLSDKREKATADLKLGLFDAMARAGLAPKALVGDIVMPALQSGDENEGHDDDPD